MIGKISEPRGERVDRLIYYLYGPGRRNEHTDPHIVAGWRHPAELEPALRAGGSRDFRHLLGLLQQPHAAMGARGYARPVWHCSMRAAPEDKMLSDDEWAQIAWDVMGRTGLCPPGAEDDAVRWVAIRHDDDHIHIVAMLARQDRRHVTLPFEKRRVREACTAAEKWYGLRSTERWDRTAPSPVSRAEAEKAARRGLDEAPRITLRHAVITAAGGARGDEEFLTKLKRAGILVRTRVSVTNPGQVTGYSVAMPGDVTKSGAPVWYGGGRLAPDLSWPRLRQRWTREKPNDDGYHLTPAERNAIWDHVARIVGYSEQQMQQLARSNPTAAADAAWAVGDVLHVAAAVLGSKVLRQAADAYDRASRNPYARIPPPTLTGAGLRHTARLISAYGYVSGDASLNPVRLLLRLAALAEAVAMLRQSQHRAAQAVSALTAARHLRAAGTGTRTTRTPNAASLAAASFPHPPRPMPADPPAARTSRPASPAPRPVPRRGR